ncbi:hypothetical protein [Streptomyces sp. bgisy084]|uniref:hypothetical protein n=1 Tax=unclassified Streptomyces TaxID=2593676 RepID=UPI003D70EAF5
MTQKPICIGVLGTHSTGKTKLLRRIERELRGHGLTVARVRAALEHRGERLPRLENERLLLLASTQLPKYDLLLATVLDERVPVDESHDYDAGYRRLVDRHTHGLLAGEQIPHQRVTSDSGSQTSAVGSALQLCLREAAV